MKYKIEFFGYAVLIMIACCIIVAGVLSFLKTKPAKRDVVWVSPVKDTVYIHDTIYVDRGTVISIEHSNGNIITSK